MNQSIENLPWYELLVDDCKSIITEAVFTSRWALIEGHHQLGARLVLDTDFQKHAKGNNSFVQDLAQNIKSSKRTLYYAMEFYNQFPNLQKIPEGKNISWSKIINKYLTKPTKSSEPEEPNPHLIACPKCGFEFEP